MNRPFNRLGELESHFGSIRHQDVHEQVWRIYAKPVLLDHRPDTAWEFRE